MRWVVLALVVACSSKENPEDKREPPKQPRFAVDAFVPTYSDDSPWDAADVDAPAVETGPVTIKPPLAKGMPLRDGVLAIARVPNGWRKVDVAALTIADGAVQVPAGEPIEIADIVRAAPPAGVLVIADGTSEVDQDLGFALASECWTFAMVDGSALTARWPEPCPAVAPDGKPQIVLVIGESMHELGVTAPRELVEGSTNTIIERLKKLRGPFAKRTDFLYTTARGLSLSWLVTNLDAIAKTGFTGGRWVPPVWLPMRMGASGAGFDPPPPPQTLQQWQPPPPGPSRPPLTQVRVSIGDARLPPNAAYTPDEIARILRSRAGVFRACYQKELNRTPGIMGTLVWSVLIEPDGIASKVAGTGTLRNDAVSQCVGANIQRLKFPPKGVKTNFKVTFTFVAS